MELFRITNGGNQNIVVQCTIKYVSIYFFVFQVTAAVSG